MKYIIRIINTLVLVLIANYFWIVKFVKIGILPIILILFSLVINIFPSIHNKCVPTFRLRMCADGYELLILFLASAIISTLIHIVMAFKLIPYSWTDWVLSALIATLIENVVFWNGIIRVYCTSVQLGIKQRIIGLLCGLIPIANICALCSIIKIVSCEVKFESAKINLNKNRKDEQICHTKYPILLVHGVFFRDYKHLNYWGRIPAELKENGAVIFYGNHESTLSIQDSGNALAKRIHAIISETGCEKINIIAHSKGGLDCRYAITKSDIAPYVASLTTINTPHRGCLFVDSLLNSIPVDMQLKIEKAYNSSVIMLGEKQPDFMTAVSDLTDTACQKFNAETPDMPDIFYQSVGSKLNKAVSGKFPTNFSYPLVKHFSGNNDGLVSEPSFRWGSKYTLLTVKGKRGISHADVIDLNRENIPDFDVREFYVQLVADLKNRGF
ncbi:MAG: triacylglycerol lipase [Acutalibacteraceae bacterium]|nr:triacylglycerol lipase [Acutalibacteraceae bacterium]